MTERKLYAITCCSLECNCIVGYVLQHPSAYHGQLERNEIMCWNCASDFCDVGSLLQLGESNSPLPTRNDLAIAQNEQPQIEQRLGIIQYFNERLEMLQSKMPTRQEKMK